MDFKLEKLIAIVFLILTHAAVGLIVRVTILTKVWSVARIVLPGSQRMHQWS